MISMWCNCSNIKSKRNPGLTGYNWGLRTPALSFWRRISLLTGTLLSRSVCLDVVSLSCVALDRLQLGAEVHAPLTRPHLRLSIDERTTEPPWWWRRRAWTGCRVEPLGPTRGIQTQEAWRAEMGDENSSVSQLVCCSSREVSKAHADVALKLQGPGPGTLFYNWYIMLTHGWGHETCQEL